MAQSRERLTEFEDQSIVDVVKSTRRESDRNAILVEIQETREKVVTGEMGLIIAPLDVLEAINSGKPYDKSRVLAVNPKRQSEIDKMFKIGTLNKIIRKIRRITGTS